MNTPDDFFIPYNEVKLSDEFDYTCADEYLRSVEALYLYRNHAFIIRLIASVLICVFSMAASSCDNSDSSTIASALSVVEERPDSAYLLLKDINYSSLTGDDDKANYIYAHALANIYLNRSLLTDTLIPQSIEYFKAKNDTARFIKAHIAQAYHLRSIENNDQAFNSIDSIVPGMPPDMQKVLNQELLTFSFKDHSYKRAIEIIDRQIALTSDSLVRFDFEMKKLTPLLVSGRINEAENLCDSLLSSPTAIKISPEQWMALRINHAMVLGERRETAPAAIGIIDEIINRIGPNHPKQLEEFYLAMANLQLNAGHDAAAQQYIRKVEDGNMHIYDPVAWAYIKLLKIVLDYNESGVISLSRFSNLAYSFRELNDNLEVKRQERDNALEASYDLSRANYELTIRHQRMWIAISISLLILAIAAFLIVNILRRRKQKLLDAEERIETLELLLKSANNPATDKKQGLLKKLLLQQLGIIKTFAESPSAQNQEALRKISNIGSETPLDSLVRWEVLYPVIDELYNGFHKQIIDSYPDTFSEREIQILCLMKAEFSTKEIGVVLQQSTNSIYVSKTSIRKKLGVQPKEDFMSKFDH